MPFYLLKESCCFGCFSLRSGAILTGTLYLLTGLMTAFWWGYLILFEETGIYGIPYLVSILLMIQALLEILCSTLLTMGAYKNKTKWISPWFCLTYALTCAYVASVFAQLIYSYISWSESLNNRPTLFYICLATIAIVIRLAGSMVVSSYCKQESERSLKEERKAAAERRRVQMNELASKNINVDMLLTDDSSSDEDTKI